MNEYGLSHFLFLIPHHTDSGNFTNIFNIIKTMNYVKFCVHNIPEYNTSEQLIDLKE